MICNSQPKCVLKVKVMGVNMCVNRIEIMRSTLEGMIQGISFIISPSTAALSHRKTVSARTSKDSNKETHCSSSKEGGHSMEVTSTSLYILNVGENGRLYILLSSPPVTFIN